ncbi:glycosyl transferase [Rhizobiales bacterium RZME27]|uniref:Glycosyl transferase n=1 Tax=Endobacterium cereale TaxID=2663029 RepID=A0A6A8AM78_9HYPH|nr:glycosyl transferase [Endobacterium cereale]MEB2842912.1 glycosyl transferase [Endobacterium cereale]MQY49831.1 glycosyl transferase [Endobacterium cereale]
MTDDVFAAKTDIKQVICINWGTKYGAPFVNRLYAMVKRNITPPFTFTCFTDNRAGINEGILCEDLPPLGIDKLPEKTPGIWGKSRLWNKELGSLKGTVLFLDLDLMIVGSLDPFFEVGDADDVFMARNQTTPFERLGQSSVLRFTVGKLEPLFQKFNADPQGTADKYRYEQRFVTRNAPGGVKFFPRKSVLHFRQDCRWPFPLNYVLAPTLPSTARIVLFPRGLHPQHAAEGRYGGSKKALSPIGHLTSSLDGKLRNGENPFRYLRHYILPTPWIHDHWHEG